MNASVATQPSRELQSSNYRNLGAPRKSFAHAVSFNAQWSDVRLFVSDGGAGGTGKVDHLETSEGDFPTPLLTIRRRLIEGFAELDQHVQRHE